VAQILPVTVSTFKFTGIVLYSVAFGIWFQVTKGDVTRTHSSICKTYIIISLSTYDTSVNREMLGHGLNEGLYLIMVFTKRILTILFSTFYLTVSTTKYSFTVKSIFILYLV